jgi:hypothetical protein
MNVSPLTVNFMLAFFCSPNPKDELGERYWSGGAGAEAREWLHENDLITDPDDGRATSRGEAWVKFICETPLPEQTWVLPPRNGEGK